MEKFQYKKINKISRIKGKIKVYNFSVPGYENYIANGFVVHNCENHEISKNFGDEKDYLQISPDELVGMSRHGVKSISFSYTEPTLYPYYIQKVAELSNIPVAVKSNGFVHVSQYDLWLKSVDAWNIDIKGDEDTYKNVCGNLNNVLDFIKTLKLNNRHVEISYLPTPQTVTDKDTHIRIAEILRNIDVDMPVHILYFYPNYKINEMYDKEMLLDVYEIFKDCMNYVYVSNVFGPIGRRNTCCTECGAILIERTKEVKINKYSCCGKDIHGILEYNKR